MSLNISPLGALLFVIGVVFLYQGNMWMLLAVLIALLFVR